jgi:exosortase C (VPDSG-CTERM-specific)
MDSSQPLREVDSDPPKLTKTVVTALEQKSLSRRMIGPVYFGLLTLMFLPILAAWAAHAAASQLHSYVILIPFVSGYLLSVQRDRLPKRHSISLRPAVFAGVAGLAVLAIAYPSKAIWSLSENDYLALMILSFLCLLMAGGFFFLGRNWMAAAAFPVAFLCFMIPLPDRMVEALETASQLGSAETAGLFFGLSGTPFLRDGTFFQLPNIALQVAQECSGIRSSWILFITSLVASHLFLRSPWRRAVLVAFVVPLGLLRNGLRVCVIGLLCVHIGPEMIESPIHRRGGPLFFALSLIPLFLLLWWLRRGEAERVGTPPTGAVPLPGHLNEGSGAGNVSRSEV